MKTIASCACSSETKESNSSDCSKEPRVVKNRTLRILSSWRCWKVSIAVVDIGECGTISDWVILVVPLSI